MRTSGSVRRAGVTSLPLKAPATRIARYDRSIALAPAKRNVELKEVDLYSVEYKPVDGQAGGMPSKSSPRSLPKARARAAANIRRLRTDQGLSQEQLAEAAEFHRTYVSQLERCVTNISIDGLERLAQALGVDIVELLQPPA